MAKIDGKAFTITAVQDSNYEDGDQVTEGVKITTKEEFVIDGEPRNKFHTTRQTIVDLLKRQTIREDLANGMTIGPVKCEKPNGKKYYVMVDA